MIDEAGPLPGSTNSIGGGLQHERAALAWERTAIAMMVAGVAFARYAAKDAHFLLGSAGIAQTAGGGALLIWAGKNNKKLHDPSAPASAVPQFRLTRAIGLGTVVFNGVAMVLAIVLILAR